jgi:hypothetical protein
MPTEESNRRQSSVLPFWLRSCIGPMERVLLLPCRFCRSSRTLQRSLPRCACCHEDAARSTPFERLLRSQRLRATAPNDVLTVRLDAFWAARRLRPSGERAQLVALGLRHKAAADARALYGDTAGALLQL